ncbi:hypothetical protein [Clostridium thailandense]|uniref:hypothetical protein n=1 Tax=Clostridium thailandense TaxID=2794346 RepID=UPI0039893094
MLQSIIDEDEFKVLARIADYEKGINELTDAVAKMQINILATAFIVNLTKFRLLKTPIIFQYY